MKKNANSGVLPQRYHDAVGELLMNTYGYSWGELRRCRQAHAQLLEQARTDGVPAEARAAQISQLDVARGGASAEPLRPNGPRP